MKFEISPNEFNITFMKSHGYIRKKCKKCGAFFWTLNEDLDTCGEAPCNEYTFLNNPPTSRRYNLRELRDTFLKFFERNGHEIIPAYPVVARWRDDLLVTIASIAVFQPYVTSGIASPPANPLVICQPCLRFDDIDNVGLTAGRHLTIFEMGGAHAFNYSLSGDGYVYWKDETLELHHEFATRELGIPEDLIIYKEHFWIGGGNAGPDVEGIISGLEVSTLVFMMYKIKNESLERTPVLTVDTGYGIERWAWLSQGTPTAFHAIYGDILKWIMRETDLSIEDYILIENTKYSGHYDSSNREIIRRCRQNIASKYDYSLEELNNKLELFERLTVLLDHSKSVILLIRDGAIPSNVKEGYLTRMLLRRIFKIIRLLDIDYILSELFRRQIDFWKRDYPGIHEVSDVILEIVESEWKRYQNIIDKSPTIIKRYLRKYGQIGLNQLIEIYDSYGIHPEFIAEAAKRYNIKVEIPSDFYKQVAKRHERVESVTSVTEVPEDLSKFKTEELFYINPYWRTATGRVLDIYDEYVILDKTIFYPEGGGQKGDVGWIITPDGRKIEVLDTIKVGNVILHKIARKDLNTIRKGDLVTEIIDWNRRYQLMMNHTATHILLSAIRKVLGEHIWQAGAEKRPEIARLDVTHYKLPESNDILEIEKLCNEVISKSLKVSSEWIERSLAERKYGIKIYQGGAIPGKMIRIVKVGDWDVEACCGTHVSNTRELMHLKILNVEKIHDGVIRFTFVSGPKAIEQSRFDSSILCGISKMLDVSKEMIPARITSLMEEYKSIRKKLDKVLEDYMHLKAEELYRNAMIYTPTGIKIIVSEHIDVNEAIKVGEHIESKYDDIVYVGLIKLKRGINLIVFLGSKLRDKGFSAVELAKILASKFMKGGGGKGDDRYARFGGIGEYTLNDVIKEVISYVGK